MSYLFSEVCVSAALATDLATDLATGFVPTCQHSSSQHPTPPPAAIGPRERCAVVGMTACSECASGFEETEDEDGLGVATCEPVSSECTVGNGVRAFVSVTLAALVVFFTVVSRPPA